VFGSSGERIWCKKNEQRTSIGVRWGLAGVSPVGSPEKRETDGSEGGKEVGFIHFCNKVLLV
jgi:hypothetical protein